ncbi:hypothetical protein F5B21DRAFT_522199 [Xylaria acuta]|nr:hypothetical protein F5B21DRAFT_522199 [Xylaria acuta]
MAPTRRARRQANSALAQQPSIEATIDHAAPLLPNGNNLTDYGELGGHGHPGNLKDGQGSEPVPQMHARVLGGNILVPRTFSSDTYDPDAPPPGTPEPESHTPERYAAWGRKHFGQEWYEKRERMLQERNIYMDRDLVYEQRQRALRVLEHTLEGRPSMPAITAGARVDENWKRLWSRLSKDLPDLSPPTPATVYSSDHGSDTDLSGYDTYDPTPSPREPTPEPDDPLQRLELNRKRFHYNEETYQFYRVFMLEGFIDERRKKREDELGDEQREKVREETEKIRFVSGTLEASPEYRHLTWLYGCWKKGMTQEQIEASEREGDESVAQFLAYIGETVSKEPEFRYDKEQLEERYRAWDSIGFSKELQAELTGVPSPSRVPPRQAKDAPHKIRSGRVTKNASKKQGNGRKTTARQQSAPKHEEAQPPSPGRSSSQPNILVELGTNTQAAIGPQRGRKPRKTYTKERASRRLTGQLPEFGILPGGGERKAESFYKASPPQPLNTRRTGRNASKKSAAVQSSKPQGISASGKPGRGRPKKLAK